jgi:monomeric sarcosine oxidase
MRTFDVIVIGAGAMGSASAYYLAKRGLRVLLLEQFELDHRWGSSYGHSRIIRYSYDVVDYIQLAQPNYKLWRQVEAEAQTQLLITTGGIDFGHTDDASLTDTRRSLEAMAIAHEVLPAAEANRRFPQYHFTDEMSIIYQADSGMLRTSSAVKTHAQLAQKHGATLREREPVQAIDVSPDSVTVTTAQASYSAAKLVVTAGAWAGQLLQQTGLNIPFQTLRCQLAFFQPHQNAATHDVSQMPVFIYHRDNDIRSTMYGLPSYDGTGVKAAFNGGDPKASPEVTDYAPDDATVQRIRDAVGDHLPAVQHGQLLDTRICLYTQTPDAHFVIDKHPAHEHIIIGGGFSGHGFKFSTIIGQILSDLAADGTTAHDISLFRLARFEAGALSR